MNHNQSTETRSELLEPPPLPRAVDAYEAAYAQHEAELAALTHDELLAINLDVPGTVTTVLGVAHEIRGFRAELARLPDFDIRVFDELESYAMALACAHSRHLTATEVEDIKPLYDEALVLRETLLLDARALVHRGLLEGKRIERLTGTVGHRNVATDLHILAILLRDGQAGFVGKSGVALEELEHAVELSTQLLHAIGRREQADANVNEVAGRRVRAYTLLLRRYDEVRKGLHFLRWSQGDAEQFTPSLYAGRTRKKSVRSDIEPVKTGSVVPTSEAPLVTSASTPVPPATTETPSSAALPHTALPHAATPTATPSMAPFAQKGQPYLS